MPVGLSNVMAIAGGTFHSLALKSNGTVVAWGAVGWDYGQTNVPAGLSNVVAIAGGSSHSLALKSDGTIVAWGNNGFGQMNIPAGLSNVVAIGGGFYHTVALRTNAIPAPVALLTGNNVFQGTVTATGFTGNGSGLTALAAANVTGTLGTNQIPNLDASKITTGALADTRLSTNVALLDRNLQTFSGSTNSFSGRVGIGTTTPGSRLTVLNSGNGFEHTDGTVRFGTTIGNGVGGYGAIVGTYTTHNLFLNSHGNVAVLDTNGNFGLGTFAPATKLHVVNGSGFFGSDSSTLPGSAGEGVRVFYEGASGGGAALCVQLRRRGSATNLILQGPGGNVGIRTASLLRDFTWSMVCRDWARPPRCSTFTTAARPAASPPGLRRHACSTKTPTAAWDLDFASVGRPA
jgi:hypothetical protein